MKIYLASFRETQYHGPGRLISVSPTKPENFNLSFAYKQFIPEQWISEGYDNLKIESQQKAANFFNEKYNEQLDKFKKALEEYCIANNKKQMEVLPFCDGDTLLSWERFGYNNYRGTIGSFLKSLGYEVFIR